MKLVRNALLTAFAAVSLAGCTNAPSATRTLEKAGYTDVETTGYKVFGCGDDDDFHTGFRATNPRGERVEGVVCGGFLKGDTIRF